MGSLTPRFGRALLTLVASLVVGCTSVVPSAAPSGPSGSPAPTGLTSGWWPVETGPAATPWTPTLDPATIDEPLPHVYGGSMATAVVAFRGALLAFGGVNGGCCDGSFSTDTHAVVWGSADGRSWQLHEAGPELALGSMTAVAASADRVVVVGTRHLRSAVDDGSVAYEGAVWTSEDGEAWELVADLPVFSAIVATATGFVAASNVNAFPELWWSETGSTWRRIAGANELGTGRIERLLATPIGFFGVGSSFNTDAPNQPAIAADPPAAVWRSADGESWRPVPTSAMFSGAWMRDVAWSDGRLLAVGYGGAEVRSAFWTSTDGDTWDRIDAPGLEAGPGMTETRAAHVLGVHHGFAVTGTWSTVAGDAEASGTAIWTTQDGLGWQGMLVPGHAEIFDWMVAPGGGVVVVGWGSVTDVGPAPLAWTIATP